MYVVGCDAAVRGSKSVDPVNDQSDDQECSKRPNQHSIPETQRQHHSPLSTNTRRTGEGLQLHIALLHTHADQLVEAEELEEKSHATKRPTRLAPRFDDPAPQDSGPPTTETAQCTQLLIAAKQPRGELTWTAVCVVE